jgi:hypothetical protein
MTDIPRYLVDSDHLAARSVVGDGVYEGAVDVVLYADHLAAVAAARYEGTKSEWVDADATGEDLIDSWGRRWIREDRHVAAVAAARVEGDQQALSERRIGYEAGLEQGQRDVFAFHPEWTVKGMCKPDCLPCQRLTELINERYEGAQEAARAVEKLPYGTGTSFPTGQWVERGAAIDAAKRGSE